MSYINISNVIIHTLKQQYKRIGLTEKKHNGPEERKGEEHLRVADKWVIYVVLRVHLSCECHTGNNIHGEAAKTSAETHTHKHKYEVGQKKTP